MKANKANKNKQNKDINLRELYKIEVKLQKNSCSKYFYFCYSDPYAQSYNKWTNYQLRILLLFPLLYRSLHFFSHQSQSIYLYKHKQPSFSLIQVFSSMILQLVKFSRILISKWRINLKILRKLLWLGKFLELSVKVNVSCLELT